MKYTRAIKDNEVQPKIKKDTVNSTIIDVKATVAEAEYYVNRDTTVLNLDKEILAIDRTLVTIENLRKLEKSLRARKKSLEKCRLDLDNLNKDKEQQGIDFTTKELSVIVNEDNTSDLEVTKAFNTDNIDVDMQNRINSEFR